ncbi:MAG: leucyl/phenylalanyl-tRNA--protein transferase [Bacteroidetes bacterium]|nr:MAG: leucyl/phenylalanyl-tRNA--protein transferase [Bacteroidota bacterium]
MVYLTDELWFPPFEFATRDGLLAVGGDLSVDRLLLAYRSGIFPWYSEGEPILWWSPDPRMVLFPKRFKVSKSLLRIIQKNEFSITFNTAFADVIRKCAAIEREGQADTWITNDMVDVYQKLHELGHAHSVEVWRDDKLVGGLYGIDLPEQKVFCGESMFSKESNASKVAFYYLIKKLKAEEYTIIDCQVHTLHLESLGAEEIPRTEFLNYLL